MASRTRVARFLDGFRWEGVECEVYKTGQEADRTWRSISRHVLIGGGGEETSFHLRYFEAAPGGFSSLEKHGHAHVVVAVRGKGRVILNESVHDLQPFDTVYVAPWTPHQFLAVGEEPFGFFCIVDAKRDRPRAVSEQEGAAAAALGVKHGR